jgi:hypothetical protein
VDLPVGWKPSSVGADWLNYVNWAPYFGTDLSTWPVLNTYGDSTTAQDITVNIAANPVIQGTGGALPAGSLPFGNNTPDADGFYVIQNLYHRGNFYFQGRTAQLVGNHVFTDSPNQTVETNGVSDFPAGPATCWVGYTKITYQSRNNIQLLGCSGWNPHHPLERDGVTIGSPVKIKLRYYKISNKTPDPVIMSNNDHLTGRIDGGATRTPVTWDIQHFHMFCPGHNGYPATDMPPKWARAFQLSGSKDSKIRNFYIEKAMYDIFAGGFHTCDLMMWYGTATHHPQRYLVVDRNGAGVHADGIQAQMIDCTPLRRRGIPHMKQVMWHGDVNNAHVFTNPSGSGDPTARVNGLDYELVLFGGFDPSSPAGQAGKFIHTGASQGSRFKNCWINCVNSNSGDSQNWYNRAGSQGLDGKRNNLYLKNLRYRNGDLYPDHPDDLPISARLMV